MAALPAGVKYGLSSEPSCKENKELVFLKLTDSALKAIEDFIRNNRDKLAKPKIQFLPGNEGKICIPAPANGNGSPVEATFHFSINSNAEMESPQGSFECVRSGGARRLESCGPLPRRMRVHANDDSYEATKDRMARTVAAEQSKYTRVIKPNQTDIGRRVKVRSSHPLYSNNATAQLAERAERADRERLERSDRPERPDRPERLDKPDRADRPDRPDRPDRMDRPDRPDRPDRSDRPDRLDRTDRSEIRAYLATGAPTLGPGPARGVGGVASGACLGSVGSAGGAGGQPQRPPFPHNPDLARRSIKERLIQLLALKPFKKPELYSRLISEGMKDKERAAVPKIIPQISALKDNCYHLRRHIWNDVNEDWPFYTEEEKRILKRRKPQNLTPPVSSDSTNSLSPRASPGGKRAPAPGAVAAVSVPPGAGDDVTPPACKKQRLSLYRRPGPSPPSSGYATGSSGASSGERHASDNEDDRTVKKDNGYTLSFNTNKDICLSPEKSNEFRSNSPVEQTSITENEITNTEPLENTELSSVPDENVTDMEEIERQYPPITSSLKRREYKNEFAALYTEYRPLYERVAQVATLFTQLEQQLKSAPPRSPQHQSIEQRILEEYRRLRHDAEYQHRRRRVNYLHRKLEHIKRMVHQYDKLHNNIKPERVSTASTTQAY